MERMRDALEDYTRYDERVRRETERLPECIRCREPIQEEHLYDVRGEVLCEECLRKKYRFLTENYLRVRRRSRRDR